MTLPYRMFHPTRHLWIRVSSTTTMATATSSTSYDLPIYKMLEIGLTTRGIEDIGDVTSIRSMVKTRGDSNIMQNVVSKGDELLQIQFDGHTITSADELYHTVWETYSDQLIISSPVSGVVMSLPLIVTNEDLDEDTVLVTLKASEDDWRDARQNQFVHERDYLKLLKTLPHGKFAGAKK